MNPRLRFLAVWCGLLLAAPACTPRTDTQASPPALASPLSSSPAVSSAGAPSAPAGVTSQAVLTTVTLFSPALDREVRYVAILPAPLTPGQSYPVLYLLHGAWGSYADWSQRTPLLKIHGGRPFVLITPDGGPFGWYVDSPVVAANRYETFVTRDLVRDVDARFPTVRGREGRGLAGLSMGGHGALSLAARHPDLFSSASSLSGIVNVVNHAEFLNHAERWHLGEAFGPFASNSGFWKEHSVVHMADRFTTADVALLFDTGVGDTTGAVRDNRQLEERLTNRAIVHTYREFPGGHTWTYWGDHVGEHIDFHLANFAGRAEGKPPETGRHVNGKMHQHYVDRALGFEKENEEVWSDPGTARPVVFLGSSSFEKLAVPKAFPGLTLANRGIGGDVIGIGSRGILHRLYCSVFDCRPRAVLIMNGTNDLAGTAKTGKPTVDEVVATYEEVVRRIRDGLPDTPILICGCFPTRGTYAPVAPLIAQFNERCRRIAEDMGGQVRYVDTWVPFADAQGMQQSKYSDDGLHLNAAGEAVVRPLLLEALAGVGIHPTPEHP